MKVQGAKQEREWSVHMLLVDCLNAPAANNNCNGEAGQSKGRSFSAKQVKPVWPDEQAQLQQ